jgi:hypothetical protein
MDMSHDYTVFGPQIPFLGSECLFSPFWTPKLFFLLHVKLPIDGYVTRPTLLILGPKFRFWALKAYFRLFDRWIYHTTILILGTKFRFWALGPIFACLTPKRIYFLHLYKISDRLMGHMTYLIFEPPSAQSKDPADSKFQHQTTKYSAFLVFWNLA